MLIKRLFLSLPLAILLAVLGAALPAAAQDTPAIPPGLTEAVDDCIALLEAGKYEAFLNTYARPEDLKAVLGEEPMEALIKDFAEGNAGPLLEALKSVKGLSPTYDPEEHTATYDRSPDRNLVFIEIGGRWYLMN
ncbi:MAG: hypothetical protein AB1896_04140 [Thermodesulfobacteriota bacterium]